MGLRVPSIHLRDEDCVEVVTLVTLRDVGYITIPVRFLAITHTRT
jgi:hypothetical protein